MTTGTLLAIMKYMSRPKNAAVKDIDIDIADIFLVRNIGILSISAMAISTLFFSSGQTAVKLSGAEAADRAQCAAPD